MVVLNNRENKKVQSTSYVAKRVSQNINKRKFTTTLTRIGRLNAFMAPRFPLLVERLILKNLHKFEEKSK